ncbi:hypothetical protein JTB14_031753, partial [Gonioctena quinquepunctata]
RRTPIGEPENEERNECTQTNTELPQEPTTQDEKVHKVMHMKEAEETPIDEGVNIQQGMIDKGVIISKNTILKPKEEKKR